MIASTPQAPYYAVIFTSTMTESNNGYCEMANKMTKLAATQDGFLGVESARESIGITVSYWSSLEAIKNWKAQSEHLSAQSIGKSKWYSSFKVRITKVDRDYSFNV